MEKTARTRFICSRMNNYMLWKRNRILAWRWCWLVTRGCSTEMLSSYPNVSFLLAVNASHLVKYHNWLVMLWSQSGVKLYWTGVISVNLRLVVVWMEVVTQKTVMLFLTVDLSAVCVAGDLHLRVGFENTCKVILEKNRSAVIFVTRNFGLSTSRECMSVSTKVSYHNALCVVGDIYC